MTTNQTSSSLSSDCLRGQTLQADSKASMFIAMNLAILGFLFDKVSEGPLAVQILICVAGFVVAATADLLCLAVLPRTGNLGNVSDDDPEVNYLTKIVLTKYRCVRHAIRIFMVAISLAPVVMVVRVAG
ncbi:hypothetical protein GCM10010191_47500 [Actinomadura vinacea]|uniref:Pycsar effector protein domain-containing protein n=1 Tax=Actinomadura vinacea TaxID=115336 RepID=A0ABN3JHT4_9ACTN